MKKIKYTIVYGTKLTSVIPGGSAFRFGSATAKSYATLQLDTMLLILIPIFITYSVATTDVNT
jgi:hypothetical protein